MTRGRKPLIRPTRNLHTKLDAQLLDEIEKQLWSDAEQRIPKGAYQVFLTDAVVRMLRQRALDLSPFAGSMPSEHVVYAFEGTRNLLETLLKGKTDGTDSGASKPRSDLARKG